MQRNRLLCLGGLAAALLAFASPPAAVAQESFDPAFELTFAAGAAGIDAFESTETAYSLTVSFELNPCKRPRPPRWCYLIRIPIWRIPDPYPDPWKRRLPPFGPGPRPPLDRLSELEVGPSWVVTPEVEVVFSPEARLSPSLFLGAGFMVEDGRTTRVGQDEFRTSRSTSPALSWGGALTYGLTDRTGLRLEVRGVTAFLDEMTVFFPGGQFTAEGGDTTTIFGSAGLSFSF